MGDLNLCSEKDFRAWICIPDLHLRRVDVVDALDAALAPQRFSLSDGAGPASYAISGGTPLAEFAPVRAALNMLAVGVDLVSFEQFSSVLRAPELHATAAAWMKRIDVRYMHFYSVMLGNISYDQAQAMEVEQSKTVHDVARIELLIDVYFPQTRKCYDLYTACRDAVEEVRLAFKKTFPNGNLVKNAQFLERFEAAGKFMEDANEVLRIAMVGALRHPELPKWTFSDKSYS